MTVSTVFLQTKRLGFHHILIWISGFALVFIFLTGVGLAQEVRYQGLCDASAAVALGADFFVVAEDEHNTLVVYKRGESKPVGQSVDLTDYLGNRKPSGKEKEADIEGAARIGDRIYWIASHGRDKKGNVEETRWRFFATDLDETAPTPTVKGLKTPPYKDLLKDLVAEERFAKLGLTDAAQKPPDIPGGLNIEGLAATPKGHLLIGFRNPLASPGKQAILIPLTNPKEVIDKSAKAVFADAILLDLDGRGIRSIERVGTRYLIIAGLIGEEEQTAVGAQFALFSWSGNANDRPTQLGSGAVFKERKLRPEALFEIPGTEEIMVLSDDGEEKINGWKCKDEAVPKEKKAFRGITFKPT